MVPTQCERWPCSHAAPPLFGDAAGCRGRCKSDQRGAKIGRHELHVVCGSLPGLDASARQLVSLRGYHDREPPRSARGWPRPDRTSHPGLRSPPALRRALRQRRSGARSARPTAPCCTSSRWRSRPGHALHDALGIHHVYANPIGAGLADAASRTARSLFDRLAADAGVQRDPGRPVGCSGVMHKSDAWQFGHRRLGLRRDSHRQRRRGEGSCSRCFQCHPSPSRRTLRVLAAAALHRGGELDFREPTVDSGPGRSSAGQRHR
jgi:hypothetical protein